VIVHGFLVLFTFLSGHSKNIYLSRYIVLYFILFSIFVNMLKLGL